MKTKLLALVMGVMIMTGGVTQVNAESPNLFKDCGIGAMIFDASSDSDDRKWATLVNILFGPYSWSTASSSKSSGTCSGQGHKLAAAVFIHQTYATLIEDTVKGNGDHLKTVLNLFKAPNSRKKIISTIQSDLLDAMNAPEYLTQSRLEKAEIYFDIIENTIQTI